MNIYLLILGLCFSLDFRILNLNQHHMMYFVCKW